MDDGMHCTVGQLAGLSGVSVRALHHFEERGLLHPARDANGYRVYDAAEMERLQQVLLYREAGLQLGDIRRILDDPGFSAAQALREHLVTLRSQRDRIDRLISSVERALEDREGGAPMSAEERFEAFKEDLVEENEHRYGEEARARWGDETVEATNAKVRGMSEEAWHHMRETEERLREEVVAGLSDGDASGGHARAAAQLHAEWLQANWPDGLYSRETHAALAEGYLADDRFRAYYDAWAPGATEFLVAAIRRMCAE